MTAWELAVSSNAIVIIVVTTPANAITNTAAIAYTVAVGVSNIVSSCVVSAVVVVLASCTGAVADVAFVVAAAATDATATSTAVW